MPPPRSTPTDILVPYTTLFRSFVRVPDFQPVEQPERMHRLVVDGVTGDIGKGGGAIGGRDRWNRLGRWRGGRQIAVLCHAMAHRGVLHRLGRLGDRKRVGSGKSVYVRVDPGGRQ